MSTQPDQAPSPEPNDDARSDEDVVVMKFGPAPTLFGVLGAIGGGVAVFVLQGPTPAGIVGGVVFGLGIGWLVGLIAAMGWLGE